MEDVPDRRVPSDILDRDISVESVVQDDIKQAVTPNLVPTRHNE